MRKHPDEAHFTSGDQEQRQNWIAKAEEHAASGKPLLPLRQFQESFE